MIVAISYHDGDYDLMIRWSRHVAKLGTYLRHKLVIAPVHDVSTEEVEAILRPVFGFVHVASCFHTESGWPISCNKAFETIALHVSTKEKQPFLFMEPDAVPLVASWVDDIEREYNEKKRLFMGDFVAIRGVMPNGIDHMSGIAVYTWDIHRAAPSIFRNEYTAWDIASAREVVPQMARTKLIHHDWIPTKEWRRDKVDPSVVRNGAVIYHPDKLGVLFNDGLAVPLNRVEGELQTGAGEVESESSFEHKGAVIDELIEALVKEASVSAKNKKQIIGKLNEKNLIAKNPKAKTKRAKSPRDKVRKPVEEFDGPRAY